ncbi:hypothetical protein [Azospirillum griseum]|uniref:Uncharacterized protein n=1 Tax=Azospirillum griseum TaxID=2496639 RepID=A0A3S0HXT1_9PROT|nr:hypothetical protein [Azospirillum griseum]RTR16452.1 hypothetical protein EJ903_20875 [Azospirillum griseum]
MPILDQPCAPEHPAWNLPEFDRPTVHHPTIGSHELEPDEIAVIAVHQRLSPAEAIRRGAELMREPWGHAALRQMVWDLLCIARRRDHDVDAAHLSALYRRVCGRFANPQDRRKSLSRSSHPFPCNTLC